MKQKSSGRVAALAAVALVGGLVPFLAATSASAVAVPPTVPATAVTINAGSQNQSVQGGHPVTITGTVSPTTTTATVYLAVTSGPSESTSGPNTPVATCAVPTPGNYSCTYTTSSTPGTDQVTVFADNQGSGVFQNSDPNATTTVKVVGAPFKIVVTPSTSAAQANTCSSAYTVTVTDSAGNPVPGSPVSLSAKQTATEPAAATTEPAVSFCSPTGGSSTTLVGSPATGQNTTTTTAATTTAANGTTTFSVKSDTAGSVAITATDGAVSQTVSLTVGAGGAASVSTVSLTPASQNAYQGALVTETYTLKDASGNPVAGVTPLALVSSGPDTPAAVNCTGASDGTTTPAGTGTCTYTASTTATGTDTITVYVKEACGSNTNGPVACEPQATATATIMTAPTSPTITSTCDATINNTTPCPVPLTQKTENITFTLKAGAGTQTPLSGAQLQFTVTPATGQYSIAPTTCTTDANGQCTVALTNASPAAGNIATVTATLNTAPVAHDTAMVNWQASSASLGTTTLTPASGTALVGSTVIKTVTVLDQFSSPVANNVVSFSIAGRNGPTQNAGATGSCTTNASGQCSFTYTDKGSATVTTANNKDTITATSTGGSSGTATEYFVTSGGTVQQLQAGVGSANTTNCGSYSATAPYAPSGWATQYTTGTTPDTTAGNPSSPNVEACVAVRDANGNPLYGQPITVTTSGVGVLTDANGTPITGSSEVVDIASPQGNAEAFARSNTAGTQTLTFTANGVSSTVTITYTGQYIPVTPFRVIDTRIGQGGLQGPGYTGGAIKPNTAYGFNMPTADVPSNAISVALNVTAIHPTGAGNLRIDNNCFVSGNIFESGGVPSTSLVNYQPGQDVANFVIVPINQANFFGGGGGCLQVYSAGSSVNVAVDLAGYYLAGFNAAQGPTGQPVRVADTRSGQGGTMGPVQPGGTASFSMTSGSAVPVGAKAVAINVTAVGPTTLGNLRVYPDGGAVPNASNINYIPGVDKAAFVVVNLPANGKIDVASFGSAVNVLIDVFGYYDTTANVVTQTPTRILDTRTQGGPLPANIPQDVQVTGLAGVPSNAQAVLVSLTAVHATGSTGVGNLRIYPTGGGVPTVSSINYVGPTNDVANFAIVKIGSNGKVTLYSAGSPIDVLIDVVGYVPAGS